MRIKLFLLTLSIFAAAHSSAQTFMPDAEGYIADPAFHKLIKTRGYQLVSSFDTLKRKPLVMVAKVLLNGKWLYINNSGKVITPPTTDANRFISGGNYVGSNVDIVIASDYIQEDPMFEQISVNGKYGTVNKSTGKEGLPAIYDAIINLEGGITKILLNGKSGLAMANGTVVKEPQYEEISSVHFGPYNNKVHFFKVVKNGMSGLLSATGNQVLPATYTQIDECTNCNIKGNLLMIEKNNKWGLSYNSGQIILQPIYENIRPLTFSGQMMVTVGQGQEERYGLIDSLGKVLMPPVYSGMMEYLNDEKLIKIYNETEKGPRYGRATIQGKILLKPAYETITRAINGVFFVRENGKMGVVSLTGKTIVQPSYDHIYAYKDFPYILVNNKDQYGLLSPTGTVIFPVLYETIIPGKRSFLFKKDDKWGVMNAQGKVTSTLNYDKIETSDNYLIVTKDYKAGIINTEGKIVVPIKYDRFRNTKQVLEHGLAEAVSGRTRLLIDRYGNEYPT